MSERAFLRSDRVQMDPKSLIDGGMPALTPAVASQLKIDSVIAVPHAHYCTVPGLHFQISWSPTRQLFSHEDAVGE